MRSRWRRRAGSAIRSIAVILAPAAVNLKTTRSWAPWIVLPATRPALCAVGRAPRSSRRRARAGWSNRSALVDRAGAIGGVVAGRLL
jgi:hypothetical protein